MTACDGRRGQGPQHHMAITIRRATLCHAEEGERIEVKAARPAESKKEVGGAMENGLTGRLMFSTPTAAANNSFPKREKPCTLLMSNQT